MLLQLDQRNELIFALRKDFDPNTLALMLVNNLGRKLHDIIIPTGTNYQMVVETVVSFAEQEGWTWNLIEGALAYNPNGPNLKQFVAKHPDFDPAKGPPPVVDYLMAHTVRAWLPFIDRKPLREALREMREPDGPRILVVTGDRMSGKTYTKELITFFTEKTPNNRAVYVDLGHSVYEARFLTETIGQWLGMDVSKIPEQEDEQKARWVQRLCGWIIARIVSPGDVTVWFVFDSFRPETLLPETRDWIEELAVQTWNNISQCRVVLLDYNDVLPFDINDYASRENIARIGRDELIDFFEQLNREYKKTYPSAALRSTVDLILNGVNAAISTKPEFEKERLRLISKAVNQTARELFV